MRRGADVARITKYAILVNACQIACALGVAIYSLTRENFNISPSIERYVMCFVALIVIWGAALDIREAYSARNISRQRLMLEDAYSQLETLNATLRAQRHDFMNHIQVIYGLTEMDERKSAIEYMEKLYADIQKVGRSLKTSIPAVNALIAAKMNDCEEKGIAFICDIDSAWRDMPVPGWEMCRVLGNLIDNAIDAVGQSEAKEIKLSLHDDIRGYSFSVENTGKQIPEDIRETIFQMGFSTKRVGRGMGLHIVKEILTNYGGKIELGEKENGVIFSGFVPKFEKKVEINA